MNVLAQLAPVLTAAAVAAIAITAARLAGRWDDRHAHRHPAAGSSPPPGAPPQPGHHIPTTLDCILACLACRQTPAGFCTCPTYCGHTFCGAFTSRDVRWLARLKIGDHS